MKHNYLDTLFKIRHIEEIFGADRRKIPDVNLKIRRQLLREMTEEDAFELTAGYIAKTRTKLRKLRKMRKDNLSGLDYLEQNRQRLFGMQEREVEEFINEYYHPEKKKDIKVQVQSKKQQKELEREQERQQEREEFVKMVVDTAINAAKEQQKHAIDKAQDDTDIT